MTRMLSRGVVSDPIMFPPWVQNLGPGESPQPLPDEVRQPELTRVPVIHSRGALGSLAASEVARHPSSQETGLVDEDGRLVILDLLVDRPEWQERAVCSQTDPEAFFPEKGGSTREAKRICSRCEVKSECLEYALGRDERWGVWGGLSERERRRLKRRAA